MEGMISLHLAYVPQHFLNFRPLPQLQGSLRPILVTVTGLGFASLPSVKCQTPFSRLN